MAESLRIFAKSRGFGLGTGCVWRGDGNPASARSIRAFSWGRVGTWVGSGRKLCEFTVQFHVSAGILTCSNVIFESSEWVLQPEARRWWWDCLSLKSKMFVFRSYGIFFRVCHIHPFLSVPLIIFMILPQQWYNRFSAGFLCHHFFYSVLNATFRLFFQK